MKNLRRPFFLLTIVATAVLLASCFSVAPQPSERYREPVSKVMDLSDEDNRF